jgi:DNA topoisomerase II
MRFSNDHFHLPAQVYVPELIFGHLLTSSNYDDKEKKVRWSDCIVDVKLMPPQVTGGRNGYGAKLCNIFSTEFTVETADKCVSPLRPPICMPRATMVNGSQAATYCCRETGLKYKQVFKRNMSHRSEPKIDPSKVRA